MKNLRICLLIAALALLVVGVASAQDQEPVGILEYYDDDFEIVVRDADGFEYNFFLGMELVPGDTVETFNSTAEIRLVPNASIIKVGANTEFTIDELQGREGGSTNGFSVAAGRIRNVAANVSGADYRVRTPSTVAGVRGTDFGVEVSDERDAVAVLEGSVEVTKLDTNESLTLGANEYANALGDTFEAVQLAADQMQNLFQDLDFQELSPQSVPADETSQAEGDEEADAEADAEEEDQVQDVAPAQDVPEQPDADQAAEGDGAGGSAGEQTAVQQAVARAAEVLGMEIGSVTLEGQTYAKLVLQPQVELGRLKASLYLPVIYQRDLFDPDDWYKPKGNNEWNFGFGDEFDWREEPIEAGRDFITDLALKFRSVEFGEQRDPFYIKVGNLNNMVLGHGLLVNNYANDIDFPAIRRIGLNGGVTLGRFGLEYLINDLSEPEIYGLRPFIKPFGADSKMALGITGVMDVDPSGDLPENPGGDGGSAETAELFTTTKSAKPVLAHAAADVDLGIIERDAFSIIAFSDIGTLLPYLPNGVTVGSGNGAVDLSEGWQTQAAWDSETGEFETLSSATGLLGSLFGLDYRLEYRYYKGFIKPGFYDSNYDRRRGDYSAELLTYLSDTDAPEYEEETTGIYGQAGMSVLNDKLSFNAGYMWPFYRDAETGGLTYGDDDYLKLELFLARDLTPLDIQGSFAYERSSFIPTLINSGEFAEASLFDQNTVLSGELVYPVAPMLNIAVVAKTVMARNDDGTIEYDDAGDPVIGPSFSVETRLGF